MLTRRTLTAGLFLLPAATAGADEFWYPLHDRDGRPLQNFRIPVELETEMNGLDHALSYGPADADITLVEVYDSNCGWCKYAARELRQMAEADPDLRIRMINAPGLGVPSVQAARVEYAVKQVAGEEKAIAFHEAIFALRGPVDGRRALRVATELGLEAEDIEVIADREETGQVIAEATRLANNMNLAVTPAFLLGGAAVVGWPGIENLMAMIAAVRSCDKPFCG